MCFLFSFLYSLIISLASLSFIALVGGAGCAVEAPEEAQIGEAQSALGDPLTDERKLTFSLAVGAVAEGLSIPNLSPGKPAAQDSMQRGFAAATPFYDNLLTHLKEAPSSAGITGLQWTTLSKVQQRTKKDFVLGDKTVLHTYMQDINSRLAGTVAAASLIGGVEGQGYVASTQCREEFMGLPGTWGGAATLHPCTRIVSFCQTIKKDVLAGGGSDVANPVITSASLTPDAAGNYLYQCNMTFDPINANVALSSTVTNASTECAVAPKNNLVYTNTAQTSNTFCIKASSTGVPLTTSSCATNYLNANKNCI